MAPPAYPAHVATDRLSLDRLTLSDADEIVAIWASGDVWSRLRPGTRYDEAIARLAVERHTQHWDDHGFGLWAVRLAGDAAILGWVGASHPAFIPALAHEVEIGWTLHPAKRGRGYAGEAARAARDAAFTTLAVPRVISLIATNNVPSQAVASGLGMTANETVRHVQLGETLDVWELAAPA